MKYVRYTLSNKKTGKYNFLEVNDDTKIYKLIKNIGRDEYENYEHLEMQFDMNLNLYIDVIKKTGYKEQMYNISIESLDLTDELLNKLEEKISFDQNHFMDIMLESLHADTGQPNSNASIIVDDSSYILKNIKMSVLHCQGMISVTSLNFIVEHIYFIKNTIICLGQNRKIVFKNKNSTIV